jgi:uncharacterized metal-binding protein YceD (DUF177 family)
VKKVSPLSRPLEIGAISDDGRAERIVASEAERAAIVAEHGLVGLEALSADLDVRRSAAGLIVVDGRLRAEVVQTCVVSLVPVPQKIDEPVHISYATAGSDAAPPKPRPGAEVMVDPEFDQPDLIEGTTLDLGAIVAEQFALALDPYPRAPGAALPEDAATDDDRPASPFAALAALKTPRT